MGNLQDQSKYVVGLTGGIGSGKSTVADLFKAHGIDIIDADQLSREAVEPGQPALHAIEEHFGVDILTAAGELDRANLRTIVFSEPKQKEWLEALLHPLIADLIKSGIARSNSDYCVLESPLLLETEQHQLVSRILVVDVSVETQLSRALERDGGDATVISSIIASQLNRDKRLEKADDVVTNEGSLQDLRVTIDKLHNTYLTLAKKQ